MSFCRPVCLIGVLGALLIVGCGWWGHHHGHRHGGLDGYDVPAAAQIPNPLYVPMSDREFLWNQLVDTLDDDFRIASEERVRLLGGVLTEGRIETFPLTGATWLEPWRTDSTYGGERLYSTLQSTRRRAVARVLPQTDGGYLVEVAVYKELEDVDRPEFSTVDTEQLRHDGTLDTPGRTVPLHPQTLGWIALGRDFTLEQRILSKLRGRLGIGVR
jgi:hypothetical protein